MGREFTIDELSAESGVPSRTIRFYQSKKALPPPERRGRQAIYDDTHVERLKLIGRLQDQGLTIKAIRTLLARADRGEVEIGAWLGLNNQLQVPWADDRPSFVTAEELVASTGLDRDGMIAELVDAGLVERAPSGFAVPSPALLEITVRLARAGVSPRTSARAAVVLRRHLSRAAAEVSRHFLDRVVEGDGIEPERLEEVLKIGRAHV